MTNEEFKKTLWTAADKLRGSVSAAEPDAKGRNRGVRAYLDQVATLTMAQALARTEPFVVSTGETDSR